MDFNLKEFYSDIYLDVKNLRETLESLVPCVTNKRDLLDSAKLKEATARLLEAEKILADLAD